MSNPMFRENLFEPPRRGGSATLAPPAQGPAATWSPPSLGQPPTQWYTPEAGTIAPGPTVAAPRTMTIGGTASVGFLMLAVLSVGAWLGWRQVSTTPAPTIVDPDAVSATISSNLWLFLPLVVGFGLAIGTAFAPRIARFTALPYAFAEGMVLGLISHLYDSQSEGIAVQALLATAGVFLAMLALYGLRILRATPRFVKGVVAATMGIAAMYLVGWIASFFGADLRFWHSASPLGIGISVVIVLVAAFNLIIDFDFIERGAENRAPAYMEWYGAFSLMVTLVWLYLEILRLLSKLRD